MDKKEWNGKAAESDGTYWISALKWLLIVIGVIIVIVIAASFIKIGPDDNNNVVTTAAAPTKPPEPAIKTYAIGDNVTVGTIAVNVKGAKITSEIHDDYTTKKTADQFVVVSVKITNADVSARDFSANMFKLMDDKGVKYDPADASLTGYLYYETINPGLSRTYYVAFETPKGVKGLRLLADSGVAFAGGEYAMVNLGI